MKKIPIVNRIFSMLCIVAVTVSLLAGCSKNQGATNSGGESAKKEEPYKITIFTNTYTGDPAKDDSPVKKALEEYTNTKLEITWVPSTSYNDKFNITLASGQLPMVMLVNGKPSSVINAARSGAFWELGPYFKSYPNLNKLNPNINNNISIDGKVYGIYRSRPYARNGVVYRKDWLDNVGLSEPKTIDDVYNMLKAFKTKDPDKNGKDDTYGLVATNYAGSFNITSIWFGAPNGWGEDKDGKLIPAFLTDEYFQAMKWWKKLYDEKLVNEDFAVFDPAKWTQPVLNGKGGVIIDVTDQAQRIEQDAVKANPNTTLKMDVVGPISGPKGERNLPTSGNNGMYVITKQAVKTEQDLKKVLQFFDKLNDKKAQDLINNGLEGRQYKLVDGKYAETINDSNVPKNELNDLNQLGAGPNIPENAAYTLKPTPIREKVMKVQSSEYDKYCIPNPAEPIISNTYSLKGQQLDNIINDARVKFIVGQIDEAGFKDALELWKKSGGNDMIKEYNDEYAKIKKNAQQ